MRLIASAIVVGMLASLTGCSRPSVAHLPSITGQNMLHDISQIRRGMSANEVRRVMGSRYKTVYEEGIQGIDSGIYIWEYAEGRIYFNLDGVTRVVPSK